MLNKLLQPRKTDDPIVVTDEGILIFVRLSQETNASSDLINWSEPGC